MQYSGEEIHCLQRVRKHFGKAQPILVKSPGRVNLIGEHTDYNQGLVMPAAIDRYIAGGIVRSEDNKITLVALDLDETASFQTGNLPTRSPGHWSNYILGVINELTKRGMALQPFQFAFSGDIPIGAGLSSSAALENCVIFALNELLTLRLGRREMIDICWRAEQNFAGVDCGIMDQYTSMMGKKGKALYLDCRSIVSQEVDINFGDKGLLLADTGIRHNLADSLYNERRKECEDAVGVLKKVAPSVKSLRDIDENLIEQHKNLLTPTQYSRCSYVISENQRVFQARSSLAEQNWQKFGNLLFESHRGLSTLYNVSCPELDLLVDLAQEHNDILGARMMGGGFGGCTINLINSASLNSIKQELQEQFEEVNNTQLVFYPVHFANGTDLI